jgi:catechol 2,3-dioxygenase-like lactoylglutathione lyase family enzyme
MTDGSINIVLNQDGAAFFGLTYFDVAQKSRLATLADRGVKFKQNKSLPIMTAKASDPDGNFGIMLMEADRPSLKVPALMSEGACGKLGEIAIPVSNLDSARVFYEALGFETSGVYRKPYPWGIFSDGLMAVGLHQNSEFTEPALTYFSPNPAEHIERLKAAGLEVIDLSDRLGPGNAIVMSPQGYPVNIFMGDL